METTTSSCIGLLIVGHGTRVEEGQKQFLTLAEGIRDRYPGMPVSAGFLELAEPNIQQAIEELARSGCKSMIVVPVLLFEAGHAKSDIPDLVIQSCQELGMEILGQTPPLGNSSAVVAVSKRRFSEYVNNLNLQPDELREAGFCLVGRGASDSTAIAEFHRFAQTLRSQLTCHWMGVGFLAAAEPTFDNLLGRVEATDRKIVFIQPHLLFEGRLTIQIREAVGRVSKETKQAVHVIPTLGCGKDVVDLFADVIDLALIRQRSTA